MLVCEIGTYKRKVEPDARERHVQHLRRLSDKGVLALAGRFADGKGGLVVLDVPSLDVARQLVEEDPFVKEGFVSYELREWSVAFNNLAKASVKSS